MKIGYARVSSYEQNLNLQVDALREAGCDIIFQEKVSGAIWTRRELDAAISRAVAGDEFIVWRLDRVGRTMMDSLNFVFNLDRRGVVFRSVTQNFDTKSAIGMGVLALISAFDEDEREKIQLRCSAGRAAARARGKHLGRPSKLNNDQVKHAIELLNGGEKTMAEVAGLLGVNPKTLRRALKARAAFEKENRTEPRNG